MARRFLALLAPVALVLVVLSACGEDLPTFPPTPRDLGIECTSTTPERTDGGSAPAPMSSGCATGEVCLQGHCYEGCTNDDDCTASEQCTRGVCAPRTMPRADMGPQDLGAPDLCATVTCGDSALPYCHPRSGTCVQCRTSDDCASVTPVCDIAFGVCRAFVPAQCAPCKLDADCAGAIGTFDTRCLMRDNPLERVCVARCGAGNTCPQGTVCDMPTNNCLPLITTCTTFFAASQRRGCATDGDCAPLGATVDDFLFPGSCRAGMCAAPCGTAVDCVDMAQTCNGTFCEP